MTTMPDRNASSEEWKNWRQDKKWNDVNILLSSMIGKTLTGVFLYMHSKSGDIDLTFDDQTTIHITGGNDPLSVGLSPFQ